MAVISLGNIRKMADTIYRAARDLTPLNRAKSQVPETGKIMGLGGWRQVH
jgi:hypothetical protein